MARKSDPMLSSMSRKVGAVVGTAVNAVESFSDDREDAIVGDIPVEGVCSACVAVQFRVKTTSQRPTRKEYQTALKREFDAHGKRVHPPADATRHRK